MSLALAGGFLTTAQNQGSPKTREAQNMPFRFYIVSIFSVSKCMDYIFTIVWINMYYRRMDKQDGSVNGY